jgi:hypothetical protein
MTDLITVYNNKISKIINVENDISTINKKYKDIKTKYCAVVDSIHELKYEYDLMYVVELLDIREDSKEKISKSAKNLCIFSKNSTNTVVIKYVYNSTTYKLVIQRGSSELCVYKDGSLIQTYDILKEFKPMNFNIVDKLSILDNYVNLFITDVGLRFGMMLVAYYTLIFHTLDMINEDSWEETLCKDHIWRLMFLFNSEEYIG